MDNRVVATRLVLEELGFGASVDTINRRIEAQKLVFLSQQLGIGLGYSYNWYVKGPYSPSLTKAYYSPEWSLSAGELAKFRLTEQASSAVQKIRKALEHKPHNAQRWQWLELLASIVYLKRVTRLDDAATKQRIADQKPHLNGWVDLAFALLRQLEMA